MSRKRTVQVAQAAAARQRASRQQAEALQRQVALRVGLLSMLGAIDTLEEAFRERLAGKRLTHVELWEQGLQAEEFAALAAALQRATGWAPDIAAKEMVAAHSALSKYTHNEAQSIQRSRRAC
ncbi:hypothetical protein ABPG75_013708 [Micractinium tetrahymenae]